MRPRRLRLFFTKVNKRIVNLPDSLCLPAGPPSYRKAGYCCQAAKKGDYVGLDTGPISCYIKTMKTTKPTMTLSQMMKRFSTEEACKTFLKAMRWPDGV